MLKLLTRIFLVLTLCLGLGMTQNAEAAIHRQEVGFVVVDPHDLASRQDLAEWRSVVKWAYHFPYYRFADGMTERSMKLALYGPELPVSKADLARQAEKHDLGAIVLVKVRRLSDRLVHRCGYGRWRDDGDDNGPYVELDVAVDLYVYKTEGDKLLKKRVRERGLKELGNYEEPAETVKWALCDLVNKMEHRPLIR